MLVEEITIQRAYGDRTVKVDELGATEVPAHNGGGYAHRIRSSQGWDGHSGPRVLPHLCSWTVPERVREVSERVSEALEEGVPDQKRCMLRNQESGLLEDRWIVDIALGEEIDRPFARWSRAKRGTTNVAICFDATGCSADTREKIEARMMMAAGLTMALEALDYEVSVVCATLADMRATKPRIGSSPVVFATTIKDVAEPFVASGFAHFADTGITRLVRCWRRKGNGGTTHLTDREWRELTGADLMIYVGATDEGSGRLLNTDGLPSGARIGPVGEGTLRLDVNCVADVDRAIETLEAFFVENCEA